METTVISFREISEAVARQMRDTGLNPNVTGEQVFNCSPTGELWPVVEAYYQLCTWDLPDGDPYKEHLRSKGLLALGPAGYAIGSESAQVHAYSFAMAHQRRR